MSTSVCGANVACIYFSHSFAFIASHSEMESRSSCQEPSSSLEYCEEVKSEVESEAPLTADTSANCAINRNAVKSIGNEQHALANTQNCDTQLASEAMQNVHNRVLTLCETHRRPTPIRVAARNGNWQLARSFLRMPGFIERLSLDDRRFLIEMGAPIFIRDLIEVCVESDLTRGQERFKVPAITHTGEKADKPDLDQYARTLWWDEEKLRDWLFGRRIIRRTSPCCSCTAECSWASGCECVRSAWMHDMTDGDTLKDPCTSMQFEEWQVDILLPRSRRPVRGHGEYVEYDKSGILQARCEAAKNGNDLAHVRILWECGPQCSCSAAGRCDNKVAQNGLAVNLEVFKSLHCGWGVRAAALIRKGSFIAEYAGELMASDGHIDDDTYIFTLSGSIDVDARCRANVSRYFNHSCANNVVTLLAMWDHGDLRAPHVCFYANRDIVKGEELTIDYGAGWWKPKSIDAGMRCKCSTTGCRYSGSEWEKVVAEGMD